MDLFIYFVDSSLRAFLEYFILNIRDKCCTCLNGLKSLYFNVSFLLSVYLALLCGYNNSVYSIYNKCCWSFTPFSS